VDTYASLHTHTIYSILDSVSKPDDLFNRAKELGLSALAVTEHGNMHSVVECAKASAKYGIKYIPGLEAYLAEDRHIKERGFHITLLAQNSIGYHNLCKLSTISWTDGFYYNPRIDIPLLQEYNNGIICLSGCLSGPLSRSILRGIDYKPWLTKLMDIFGERFYIEVWDHNLSDQKKVVPKLLKLADKNKIKIVATNDGHYTYPEDYTTHTYALAIGKKLTPEQAAYASKEFYLKSPDEMYKLWQFRPEVLQETNRLADTCEFLIDFDTSHAPRYVPKEGEEPDKDNLFERLVVEGFKNRYKDGDAEKLKRVRYEASVIKELGFIDYFLILWDLMKWCKDSGIPTGPGRGSAAGSIISYCLNITDLDPMEYGLLFERFLNKYRVNYPDIDIDFCKKRRSEVIRYLKKRYGSENVARIVTFSMIHAKSAVRDVASVLSLPNTFIQDVRDRIPDEDPTFDITKLSNIKITLPEGMTSEKFQSFISVCSKLDSVVRNKSVHAAGIVIGDKPLEELIPLYSDKSGLITQYEMGNIEQLGLIKIDILGLETLSVIEATLQRIPEEKRPIFITTNLTDPEAFKILKSGRTAGVFQLESIGMRETLIQLEPEGIEDIIATVSLYRPGPKDAGMVEEYLARKSKRKPIEYLHECAESIMESTYGVLVYQEQIMEFVVKLCGFTMNQADELRRVIGKKKLDLIPAEKEKFITGAISYSGIDKEQAEQIWGQIETFGRYGFNKPHAAAYAIIAYWTAYLKAHFPREFMAALMTSEANGNDNEKLQRYIYECVQRMNIKVLPPCINKSSGSFDVEGEHIRAGLTVITGLSTTSSDSIITNRPAGGYTNITEMVRLNGGKVSQDILTGLINSGALDTIIPNRRSAIVALPSLLKARKMQVVNLFNKVEDVETTDEFTLSQLTEGEQQALKMFALGTDNGTS